MPALLPALPLLLAVLLCAVPAATAQTTYVVRIVQRGNHFLYDAEAGERFYIRALQPGYGERFDRWVSLVGDARFADPYNSQTSFIMPPRSVTIEARYRSDWDNDYLSIGIGGGGCATGAGGAAALLALALYRSKKTGCRRSKKA